MAPTEGGGDGDKDGPSKETTITAAISLGLQIKTEVKVFGVAVGIEVNLGSFDIIGVRDSKFVFMETKTTRRVAAVDLFAFGAKAEQEQKDKPLKDGSTKRTYTTTQSASFGHKSDGVEKIKEGTDGVNIPNSGTRKLVSKKTVYKTTWGINLAALLGLEISRDETIKSENKIKKHK